MGLGNWRKEEGNRARGVPFKYVVLRRAKDRERGLWFGLSTAAARWRPAGRFWKRRGAWQGKKRASARQQEGEEERRDAWGPARRKKAAGKPLHGAGVGAVGGRRREQSRGWEKEDKGQIAISENSRD